jgi:arsenite/tail-anchored protein-transporting ATPase
MSVQMHFFIGKGGVGKSTTSALSALFLAAAGLDTLLVSMDPAHNQCDLFESCFTEKPLTVRQALAVKEIDTDYWIKRYLKETREHLRKTYLYQSAFNLQDHFKVLEFSPGLEEYALLLAFENVLARAADKHALVFDMAPTALSLRFFALPKISLAWLDELLRLRELICKKKEIISRIRIGSCELERDRVKDKLYHLIAEHRRLHDLLLSPSARIHLVVNNDRLSLAEARRIRERLAELGKTIDRVVINKTTDSVGSDAVYEAFGRERIVELPLVPGGIHGLTALEKFASTHTEAFADLLPDHLSGGPPPLR